MRVYADYVTGDVPETWKLVVHSMKGSFTLQSLRKTPVVLKPFESQVIHGLVGSIQNEQTQFITEGIEIKSSDIVCPLIINVGTMTKTGHIQVKACNITTKTVTIKPKAGLYQLMLQSHTAGFCTGSIQN
jgi:hypothetical protein